MMSRSQNKTTDKHIIWSDMNLKSDDWCGQLYGRSCVSIKTKNKDYKKQEVHNRWHESTI